MKKFQFRLEKIRKLKRDRKRQAQKKFAKAKEQENQERKTLRMLRQEVKLRRMEERKARVRKIFPSRLQHVDDYMNQLEFLIKHQEGRVIKAANLTDKRLEELKETSKEEKKFDRLEEIKREDYNKELESYLQKENDEIASRIGSRDSSLDVSVKVS